MHHEMKAGKQHHRDFELAKLSNDSIGNKSSNQKAGRYT